MSISSDTSWDFNYASNAAALADGYTLYNSADLSWDGAAVSLAGTDVTSAAVLTPSIDTSAWAGIQSIVTTQEEEADSSGNMYRHRFLISKEDTAGSDRIFFYQYLKGEWVSVANSDNSETEILNALDNAGMTRNDLATIRLWPDTGAGTYFALLVGMKREATGLSGSFGLAEVYYGSEVVDLGDEGAATDDLAFEPEFPYTIAFEDPSQTTTFDGGYIQPMEFGTALRMSLTMSWTGLSESERDTLQAFIEAHAETGAAFNWTPNGWPSSHKWRFQGTASFNHLGAQIYSGSCAVVEVL